MAAAAAPAAQPLNDGIPADVKAKLLEDPAVQKAIADAGKGALESLKDPKVQEQILATCKEKFPEYAASATAKIKDFVSDPEVQAKAKEYAFIAAQKAKEGVALAAAGFVKQVQQGPDGVRFLSFLGGCFSGGNAIYQMLNVAGVLFHIVIYVVGIYQLIFSLTTILFEAPNEYVAKLPSFVNDYHDLLIDKAKFISETLGRGLFYIFQGTLWLCFIDSPIDVGCGLWMIMVGVMNILIHYGGYNKFAEKVAVGYQSLSGAPVDVEAPAPAPAASTAASSTAAPAK